MVNNVIRFIVDASGNLLEQPQGRFRANNNTVDTVQFVAPFDIADSVSMTFTKPSFPDLTQYNVITTYKGMDVVEETNSLYQTVADYNVWEVNVKDTILAFISKYRNTDITMSFQIGSIEPNAKCLDFKGYFGVDSPLPNEDQVTGDYYACEDIEFVMADNGNGRSYTFGKGMYVYWNGSYWVKVKLVVKQNVNATDIPVEANAGQGYELDEDDVNYLEGVGGTGVANEARITIVENTQEDIITGTQALDKVNWNIDAVSEIELEIGESAYIDGILKTRLNDSVVLSHGEEQLRVRRNNTGAILNDFVPVYVTGAVGQKVTVALAGTGVTDILSKQIEVMTQDLDNNSNGYSNKSGEVKRTNTTGSQFSESWDDGDVIYLGATAGTMTNVEPTAPKPKIRLGHVVYAHLTNGVFEVDVRYVSNLGDLSNVDLTNAEDGDLIVKDDDKWVAKNINEILSEELEGVSDNFDVYEEKETLVDDDKFIINDSEDSNNVKYVNASKILKTETYQYFVGSNQTHKTITEAISQWATDGKPTAIVYISKGVYNEMIHLGSDANISFIGEDKYNTIVRYDKGYYAYATFEGFGGEEGLHFKNLTIISSHDDVVDYEYIELSDPASTTAKGGAYCIHSDLTTTGAGLVTIDNCIMYNYQVSCLGFETQTNQTIIVTNSEFYTYAETDVNGGDEEARNFGAVLYQTANNNQGENQKFIFNNNYLYSKNGYALRMVSYDPDGADITMSNNRFLSNGYENEYDYVSFAEAVSAPAETSFRFSTSNNNNNNSKVNRTSFNKFNDNEFSDNLWDVFQQSLTYGASNVTVTRIFRGLRLTPVSASGSVYLGHVVSYNASQYYIDVDDTQKYIISFDTNIPLPLILVGEIDSSNTYIGFQNLGNSNVITYTPTAGTNRIALRIGWSYGESENASVVYGDFTNIEIYELEEEIEKENNNIIFELRKEISLLKSLFTYGGTTAQRPSNAVIGRQYFDTTLGKPIWYDGTNWVDATGTTV